MAHTREHEEQIQTAPSLVKQLVKAFTDAPERFNKLQQQGGLFPQKPLGDAVGLPQSSGADPGRVINTILNADEAFVGNTVSDLAGALFKTRLPEGRAKSLVNRAVRAIGNFAGAEDAVGLGVAGGVIRNLPKKQVFNEASQSLKFREMVNLKKSINESGSDIGRALVKSANDSPKIHNVATKREHFQEGGVLGTSGSIQPSGVPGKFAPRAATDQAVTTLTSDLLHGKPIKGVESGKPIFYNAGDTFFHEVAHETTLPLIPRYMVFGSPESRLIREVINELDSFPRAIIDQTVAQKGLAGGVSEAFARIADQANIVGFQIEAGKAITRGDFKVYSFFKDLNRQANIANGVAPPKFFVGRIQIKDKTGRIVTVGPDGFTLTTKAPVTARTQKTIDKILTPSQAASQERGQILKETEELLRKEPIPENVLGRAAKRQVRETAGQGILDDLESIGKSPQAVSDDFFKNTFDRLEPQIQDRFRKMIRNVTGLEPGSVIATQGGKDILAKRLKDTMIDLPSKIEFLEGTERGLIALMDEATRRIRKGK